jgi:hypothetical protein
MSLSLIFCIQTGFAQKVGTKEPVSQPAHQDDTLVTIIKDCYVSYINMETLYAVVETSVTPSEEKTEEPEKKRGIGKEKSTAGNQEQTVQQTYEYTISPDVEIKEFSEEGMLITMGTVVGVGFITKADIFVMKDEVVKIIILDMEQ